MNRNTQLVLAFVAALIAIVAAVGWLTQSEPPPAASAVPRPLAPPATAPIGGSGASRPAPSAAAASSIAPLTPEQVRERFAAAIAAGPSSAPASSANAPRPGESGFEYLQRLDNEARKQVQNVPSPFGAASSGR